VRDKERQSRGTERQCTHRQVDRQNIENKKNKHTPCRRGQQTRSVAQGLKALRGERERERERERETERETERERPHAGERESVQGWVAISTTRLTPPQVLSSASASVADSAEATPLRAAVFLNANVTLYILLLFFS
jgi:hypothetical protein